MNLWLGTRKMLRSIKRTPLYSLKDQLQTAVGTLLRCYTLVVVNGSISCIMGSQYSSSRVEVTSDKQGSLCCLPDMRVFNVEGGAEPHGVLGGVVGEDDGPHRGLPRSGLAHEQHLLIHDE